MQTKIFNKLHQFHHVLTHHTRTVIPHNKQMVDDYEYV